MNRVLLLLDGTEESEKLIDFTFQIIQAPYDNIVALLIQDIVPVDMLAAFDGVKPQPILYNYYDLLGKIYAFNQNNSPETVNRIINKCKNNHIKAKLYFDKGNLTENLTRESKFSDLLIVPSGFMGDHLIHQTENELLNHLECPFIIVPNNIDTIENIVFIYDGSIESIQAIKHFGYLLGKSYHDKCIYLLSLSSEEDIQEQENMLMEYLRMHLPSIGLMRFQDKDEEVCINFLRNTPNVMVISGNPNRNWSRMNTQKNTSSNSKLSYFVVH